MEGADGDAVLRIIDRIYDSVERPELWPETIEAIGELLGARRGFWVTTEYDPSRPGLEREARVRSVREPLDSYGARCSPVFLLSRKDWQTVDHYADEFGEIIVRFLKIVFLSILSSPHQVDGRVTTGLRMAQRFLPMLSPIEGEAVTLPSKPALRGLMAALWEDGRALMVDRLQLLHALTPHLDRALRLQMQLMEREFRAGLLSAALDRLVLGVVVVDRLGLPVWLNLSAQEIIDQRNGLRLSSAGLAAHDESETRRLRDLVQSAVTTEAQGLLPITRNDDLRPLLVLAFPLRSHDRGVGPHAASGVVFITDPGCVKTPHVA